MRSVTRTTLSLGDLLEIPVGLVGATKSTDPKLETATLDGQKRVQVFAHPDDVLLAHDGIDTDHEFSVLRPQATVEVAATGERLHAYKPLQPDDVTKGVFVDGETGPEFRAIPTDEMEALKLSGQLERVELQEFIDYRTVPTDRLNGSYYVQCDPGFAKPLGTLMAAMRKSSKAAVVRFALRDRHRLGVLRVRKVEGGGSVLLLNIVTFAAQWVEPDARVLEAGAAMGKVSDGAVDAAMNLMTELTDVNGSKILQTATDAYPEDLNKLIERAVAGEFLAAPAEASPDTTAAPESETTAARA